MKGATRTMPAKSMGEDGRTLRSAGRDDDENVLLTGVSGPLAKCKATAVVTAVPRLWPRSTMRDGGILATFMAQFTVAMPSAMRPASLGSPVEWPKPR